MTYIITLLVVLVAAMPLFAQQIPGGLHLSLTITPDGMRIDQSTFPLLGDLGLGNLVVDIPAGAVTEETTIQLGLPNGIPEDSAALLAVQFTVEGHEGRFDFSQPITLSIPYPDIVPDETILAIRLWDPASGMWVPIELVDTIVVDTEANIVTGQITHFSIYGVVEETEDEEPAVASIRIYATAGHDVLRDAEEIEIEAGDEVEFISEAFDSDDNLVEAFVTWSVEEGIGTINDNGVFTATVTGTGLVIGTYHDLADTIAVTVLEYSGQGGDGDDDVAEPSIRVYPPNAIVAVGETAQFEVLVTDSEGAEVEDAVIVWESANSAVGTVDDTGLFTALAEGETTVTATSGELAAEAGVTVTAEGVSGGEGGNTISVQRQKDDGRVTRFGSTIAENSDLTIGGIPHPFNYLNGMKLFFPENSLSDDITITIRIPRFARVDNQKREVTFDGDIVTAVTFEVTVDGEVVSPFEFDTPVQVSLPYKRGLLNNLGIDPAELGMFYVDQNGELVREGIGNIEVDEENNLIRGEIAHFSDIALASNDAVTAVERNDVPDGFALAQNTPNPFNPLTVITYGLAGDGHVELIVYNILGQQVRWLVNEYKPAGTYSVVWDGTDELGNRLHSGLYFYRIKAGSFTRTRKLMMIK